MSQYSVVLFLLYPSQLWAQNISGPPELKFSDNANVSQPSGFFQATTPQIAIGGDDGIGSAVVTYSLPSQSIARPTDLDSGYYPGHVLLTSLEGGVSYSLTGHYQGVYTFSFGKISESFKLATSGVGQIGDSISQSGGLMVLNADGSYTYTDRNGVVYQISTALPQNQGATFLYPVTKVTYPNGRSIDLKYAEPPAGSSATRRLTGVQDNTGWFLKYEYAEDAPSSDTSVLWSWFQTVKAGNKAVDVCPLTALHCTFSTSKVASVTWSTSGGATTLNIGNATGQRETFLMDQYYQVTS